ncbi:lipopolysaccharide heptosyltransferase II [Deltaproteobacteria bacterium OttesenSCG-928-M10]|nr:lipopolysaccharide heptosyltransferase II [Deltaproteobacteria bacterium OttesenSCG-928-M10]
MTAAQPIDSLLIIKMSALGDVVMTLPALDALRQRYPLARIDWLVESPSAGLLAGHPHLDNVLVSPRHSLSRLGKSGDLKRAGRLFRDFRRELRSVEYDVVLDLQGLFKSGFQTFLARGRRKVGFDRTREKSYLFLNERMPAYDPDRHAALRYLDAAVYLGAEVPNPLPEKYYTPPPEAGAEADSLLAFGQAPFVVVNPGAKWLTKRWPVEHWLSLASRLAGETDLKIVVTGGRDDQEAGRLITLAAGQAAVDLCGRTSLPALAAILERAEAVVTADTGPMHLAAAVGARGLALFGPTRPWRTGPFGGHFEILTPPLDCLGCLKRQCDRPCLETLVPEVVYERLAALLSTAESKETATC